MKKTVPSLIVIVIVCHAREDFFHLTDQAVQEVLQPDHHDTNLLPIYKGLNSRIKPTLNG